MKAKKIIFVIIAVATVLMFVFMPTFTFHEEEGLKTGYHFILNIPADHHINGPLLLVQWLGILLVAAVIWSFNSSREKKRLEDKESSQNILDTASDSSGHTAESPASKQPDTGSHQAHSRE